MKRLLCVLILAFGVAADAADKPVIPMHLRVSAKLQQILKPEILAFYAREISAAVNLISMLPPDSTRHLFHWEGDRGLLNRKTLMVYITESSDPVAKNLGPFEVSSLQMIRGRGAVPSIDLRLVLLFDRIFFKPSSEPREGAFIGLVSTVAVQLYGAMDYYLTTPVERIPDHLSPEQARANLLTTYEAGNGFMVRLLGRTDITEKLRPPDRARLPALAEDMTRGLLAIRCQVGTTGGTPQPPGWTPDKN